MLYIGNNSSKSSSSERSPEISKPFDLVKQTNSLSDWFWRDFAMAEQEPIKTTFDIILIQEAKNKNNRIAHKKSTQINNLIFFSESEKEFFI